MNGVSRGRAEEPAASARWRGGTRSHGDPAVPLGQSAAACVLTPLPDGGVPSPAVAPTDDGSSVAVSGPDGASSVPLQRGHQSRLRSRTFHRVPHVEHT